MRNNYPTFEYDLKDKWSVTYNTIVGANDYAGLSPVAGNILSGFPATIGGVQYYNLDDLYVRCSVPTVYVENATIKVRSLPYTVAMIDLYKSTNSNIQPKIIYEDILPCGEVNTQFQSMFIALDEIAFPVYDYGSGTADDFTIFMGVCNGSNIMYTFHNILNNTQEPYFSWSLTGELFGGTNKILSASNNYSNNDGNIINRIYRWVLLRLNDSSIRLVNNVDSGLDVSYYIGGIYPDFATNLLYRYRCDTLDINPSGGFSYTRTQLSQHQLFNTDSIMHCIMNHGLKMDNYTFVDFNTPMQIYEDNLLNLFISKINLTMLGIFTSITTTGARNYTGDFFWTELLDENNVPIEISDKRDFVGDGKSYYWGVVVYKDDTYLYKKSGYIYDDISTAVTVETPLFPVSDDFNSSLYDLSMNIESILSRVTKRLNIFEFNKKFKGKMWKITNNILIGGRFYQFIGGQKIWAYNGTAWSNEYTFTDIDVTDCMFAEISDNTGQLLNLYMFACDQDKNITYVLRRETGFGTWEVIRKYENIAYIPLSYVYDFRYNWFIVIFKDKLGQLYELRNVYHFPFLSSLNGIVIETNIPILNSIVDMYENILMYRGNNSLINTISIINYCDIYNNSNYPIFAESPIQCNNNFIFSMLDVFYKTGRYLELPSGDIRNNIIKCYRDVFNFTVPNQGYIYVNEMKWNTFDCMNFQITTGSTNTGLVVFGGTVYNIINATDYAFNLLIMDVFGPNFSDNIINGLIYLSDGTDKYLLEEAPFLNPSLINVFKTRNQLSVNPLFQDPVNNNYRLQTIAEGYPFDSPAYNFTDYFMGAGIHNNIGAYSTVVRTNLGEVDKKSLILYNYKNDLNVEWEYPKKETYSDYISNYIKYNGYRKRVFKLSTLGGSHDLETLHTLETLFDYIYPLRFYPFGENGIPFIIYDNIDLSGESTLWNSGVFILYTPSTIPSINGNYYDESMKDSDYILEVFGVSPNFAPYTATVKLIPGTLRGMYVTLQSIPSYSFYVIDNSETQIFCKNMDYKGHKQTKPALGNYDVVVKFMYVNIKEPVKLNYGLWYPKNYNPNYLPRDADNCIIEYPVGNTTDLEDIQLIEVDSKYKQNVRWYLQ